MTNPVIVATVKKLVTEYNIDKPLVFEVTITVKRIRLIFETEFLKTYSGYLSLGK